jgi:hypothetical protein
VSDDPQDRVKHYLVKQEDISSTKSLPDFLREKPQFTQILQLDLNANTLRKYGKDISFAPFYSKARKLGTEANGYVLL